MSVSPFLRHAHTQAEFDTLLNSKSVLVVDFHASWCGPCHMIAPFFSELADKYRTVTFVKVDTERVQSVARKYKVSSLPSFLLFKDKEVVQTVKGADPRNLERMIKEHAPTAEAEASGSGSGDFASNSDISLLEYLDLSQINCLNENPEHTLKSIIQSKTRNLGDAYLESDADEQLLITIPFNQVVKIRSIVLHTKESQKGPKKIKISINNPAIGFSDVEDAEEPAVAQVLEVPEDFVKEGKHIHLRFVRLQRVNELHIFVASNHGNGEEDETRIDAIDVFGVPVATTQMSGLRKAEDD